MHFLYDANGNVGQLVDEPKSIVARYEYDVTGKTLVATGPEALTNNYRFSTKPIDEVGLIYYGNQYYGPELRRWTQKDSIGDGDGLNLYAAMRNKAANYIDPDGHRFVCADGSIDYMLRRWRIGDVQSRRRLFLP